MKSAIHANTVIQVRWNNQEREIIRGMDEQISKFHPTGPLEIDDFGPYKQNYKDWELSNLNFLLGEMLEKYSENSVIDDYNNTEYDHDVVKSMYEETKDMLQEHRHVESEISEIADLVN